jgi:tetratricopeptide (TPR) repeat protein
MIVPTLLIGVTFPILGSIYARDLGRLGRSIGEVYFVNTAGGIAGSFVGGFLLIPWLGTERTLIGASLVNASCAVLAAFLGTSPRHRQALTAGATLAVTGLLLVAHPLAPDLSVVELPRVSQSASAPESWPSAVREACPRCAEPCWAPEPPPPDNAPRPFRMLCTTCASAERARMQESLTAPRRFWDPRVISAGVYVYTRLYSATPDGRALRRRIDETPLLFYEEGLNAIVTVSTIASFPGNLSLQINGKTDASNLDDFPTEVLLAGLPLCIHPAPREVLVIGLGSGITAGAATRYEEVRQVDVLEIESAVARGALLFAENHGDVLPDPARRPPHPGHPKLRLLIRDARQHCAVTASRYDVIISEPSNPWMSGPSHLFTLEHFRNLRRAMKEDGLAVQWIHTYSMTPDLIYSVLKTFRAVFGHVLVLGYASNPGDLYLFGANHPIAFDLDRLTERMARPAIHRDFAGIGRPTAAHVLNAMSLTGEDLDRNLGLRPGREALADAVNRIPFNTDDYPFVEFEAPRQIHKQNSSTEVFQSLYRFCDTPFPPIGPDGAAARRKLGLHAPMASAFMSIGLLEKAIDVAEDGLRSVPDDNALRSLLAGYLLQRMARSPSPDLAHRIQTLTRAVAEHNASSPLPHLQLAELASLQKRHADAATHYAHAIELGQDTSGSRLAFGQALARAGRDAEAVVNLERALVLNPELLAAHAELTEALERLGFVDRAMDSLRRWINLESNANNARRLRDRLDRMRRGKEEAGTSREPPPAGR